MILLDGFYYLHACGYALPDLKTRAGRPTGMEFGFLKGLEALKRFFKDELIICWEGKNNFRYEIDPLYKINRRRHAKALAYDRVEDFKNFLAMIAESAEMEGLEGDDIIASLAGRWDRTVIYSPDKDLLQLVSNDPLIIQVPCYQCREDPRTVEWIQKKYDGLMPNQLATFLAFHGCNTDDIKGAKRVRKNLISAAILNGFPPDKLWEFELFSSRELFVLEEFYNSGQYDINLKLVSLRKEKDIIIKQRKWDSEKIGEWLYNMEFRTLKLCHQCGLERSTIKDGDEF